MNERNEISLFPIRSPFLFSFFSHFYSFSLFYSPCFSTPFYSLSSPFLPRPPLSFYHYYLVTLVLYQIQKEFTLFLSFIHSLSLSEEVGRGESKGREGYSTVFTGRACNMSTTGLQLITGKPSQPPEADE